jgi:undecaprenyl-diphosphatase
MTLVDQLDAWDRAVFLLLNGAHTPWLDPVMLAVSDMLLWFPLYAFFLFLLQHRYGWKGLAWSVPVIAIMVLCSDKGSVLLFKENFTRLRPCHQPALEGLVHLVPDGCGGRFGFISSHASNHFAIAVFMIGALRMRPRVVVPALLFWATLIAYSRVYLGVHYPGDVFVGALYGSLIGLAFAAVEKRLVAPIPTLDP